MEGGVLRYSGTAAELKARPELLQSAYLLRGSAVEASAVLDGSMAESLAEGGQRGRGHRPNSPTRARRRICCPVASGSGETVPGGQKGGDHGERRARHRGRRGHRGSRRSCCSWRSVVTALLIRPRRPAPGRASTATAGAGSAGTGPDGTAARVAVSGRRGRPGSRRVRPAVGPRQGVVIVGRVRGGRGRQARGPAVRGGGPPTRRDAQVPSSARSTTSGPDSPGDLATGRRSRRPASSSWTSWRRCSPGQAVLRCPRASSRSPRR